MNEEKWKPVSWNPNFVGIDYQPPKLMIQDCIKCNGKGKLKFLWLWRRKCPVCDGQGKMFWKLVAEHTSHL